MDLSSDEDERSGIMNCQEENEYDSKYGETRFLALDKCLTRRRWLEILEIEPDTSHASWKDENHRMFWDPEFINNLVICQKNKNLLSNKPFNSVNWIELSQSNREEGRHIHWENYAIPAYTLDIQKDEVRQTKAFISKFMT